MASDFDNILSNTLCHRQAHQNAPVWGEKMTFQQQYTYGEDKYGLKPLANYTNKSEAKNLSTLTQHTVNAYKVTEHTQTKTMKQ